MKRSPFMMDPCNSSSGGEISHSNRPKKSRADSPDPSCVSMKSNNSMFDPPNFSTGRTGIDPRTQKSRADSPEPSCVSMKSKNSMFDPPNFSTEGADVDRRERDALFQDQFRCGVCQQLLTDPISVTCGHSCCRQCINSYWDKSSSSGDFACPHCRKRSKTHPVLKSHLEKSMKQDSYQPADDVLKRVLERHKSSMKNKYESLFEGIRTQENKTFLNRIYTQLYIIEGESEGVNEEHEVLQMENALKKN